MKKIIFLMAMAITLLTTTVHAQYYYNPNAAYQDCKALVKMGNACYRAGAYHAAERSYLMAQNCNNQSYNGQYISNNRLNNKITNCQIAITNNHIAHQEARAAIGAAIVAGAIASAATGHYYHPYHHVLIHRYGYRFGPQHVDVYRY